MSKSSSLEVLDAHAEDLSTLFGVITSAHQQAVNRARPGPTGTRQAMAVLFDIVKGSVFSLVKRPVVAGVWALVCLLMAFAGMFSVLAAGGALLLFVLGPTLVFGWFHLAAAIKKNVHKTGARVLKKASPEVFVAQGYDPVAGKLFGVRVTRGGHKSDFQEPVGGTTTEFVPATYVGFRHPAGALVHLLNAHTGSYASWHQGISMLKDDHTRYGTELIDALNAEGVLSSLRDLAELLGETTQDAVAEAPVSFKPRPPVVETSVPASWDDLVLSDEFKEELQAMVSMLKNAPALRRMGIEPPKALMLYGPPGTGKTQVARTLAAMGGLSFLAKSANDLKGEFIGHSAPKIRELFAEARKHSPSILFIDEIESATARRDGGLSDKDRISDEVVAELLDQMDGVLKKDGDVFLVGATNFLDKVDSAVLSRFQNKKQVGLPDARARQRMLEVFLAGKPVHSEVHDSLEGLVYQTEGFSGRDLRGLVDAAAHRAVTRALKAGDVNQTEITVDDLTVRRDALDTRAEA